MLMILYVFVLQSFEGVLFSNSSAHSIYDRWASDEDAGCDVSGCGMVSDRLDFSSL